MPTATAPAPDGLLRDASPLFFAPPHARLRASVIVPVKDEAGGLAQTLAALAAQTDEEGAALDPGGYEVLVLANNCADETAEVARRFGQRHRRLAVQVAEVTLPPGRANIGTARRLVMDEACRRLMQCGQPRGLILSTDGDSRVAPDWVAQTLAEVARGADAVGGRVLTESGPGGDREARRFHLRDAAYLLGLARLEAALDPDPCDPWPRHHQFFGASLAVTAETYCRVGGLPVVPHLEDEALGRALRRLDARVRHSPWVRVWTSARQDGRVGDGLSTTLRVWGEMGRAGVPQIVEQPAAVEARLRARARLPRLWQGERDRADGLARALGVPGALLRDGLAAPRRPFGALWDAVEQAHRNDDGPWAWRWPRVDIAQALPDLRARLRALE